MGCKVKTNKSGKLAFRIFWERFPGGRSWETTNLADTPKNRALVAAQALLIDREIKAGAFDYLKWFPYGNKAQLFTAVAQTAPLTWGEFFTGWIVDKKPPLVKKAQERDYNGHWRRYLEARIGGTALTGLGMTELTELRGWIVHELGLTVKTAKNAMAGTLQAMCRDAKAAKLIAVNPFDELPSKWWPRGKKKLPDPFDEQERDAILAYYRRKSGREYAEVERYHYFYFSFWTGWRPSETVALRWGQVDLKRAKAEVVQSRYLGEDGATKTAGSARTVDLLPNVAAMLKAIMPLHVTDEDFVFVNRTGGPIRLDNIRTKTWYNALRALGVRPRKPSATRHTFISVMLSYGMSHQRVAELVGNSAPTIAKHYGKYIRYNDDAGLRALAASETSGATKTEKAAKASKDKKNSIWTQRESNPFSPADTDPSTSSLNTSDNAVIEPRLASSDYPIKAVRSGGKRR